MNHYSKCVFIKERYPEVYEQFKINLIEKIEKESKEFYSKLVEKNTEQNTEKWNSLFMKFVNNDLNNNLDKETFVEQIEKEILS